MHNNKVGSGLSNLGNTCFFNAVMQVILHTEPLSAKLEAKHHTSICKKTDWCIFCALETLWAQSKETRVANPRNIVANLRSIFKKFRLGRQEDSHEYLRYLVEGLQDSETGKLGKNRQKNEKIIRQTQIFKIFGGRLRTFVKCSDCHHKSLTQQRYYDLNIECQKSNSLLEGLENFFKVDHLRGANKYRCEKCKGLHQAQKGFKILTLPNVLTFQLKRFTNSLRKIGKHISFPKHLKMHRFMADQNIPQEDCIYELYGLTVHAGSSSYSGHYYSFVRPDATKDIWYEMNDSNVSRIGEQRVLAQNAYILFYVKMSQGKPVMSLPVIQIEETHQNKNKNKQNELKQNDDERERKQHHMNNQQSSKQIIKKRIEKEERGEKQSHQKHLNHHKEENLEQTKRKLSQDIEELKKSIFNQNHNDKAHEHSVEGNILLNGKPIDGKKFGDLKKQPQKQEKKFEEAQIKGKKKVKKSPKQSQDIQIEPPAGLVRKRSKEQALQQTPLQQLLFRHSLHLLQLKSKIPRDGIGHRAMKSMMTLRKSQISQLKKKMG